MSVPDLMRIGAIQTEMAQDVQTIITDPVVFDQNTCRITLQNIGFLHSLSRISFVVISLCLLIIKLIKKEKVYYQAVF